MLELHNGGPCPLSQLHLSTSHPALLCFSKPLTNTKENLTSPVTDELEHLSLHFKVSKRVIKIPLLDGMEGEVKPGESFLLPMWIHTPVQSQTIDLKMLFYYHNPEHTGKKQA